MASLQDFIGLDKLRDAWPKWKANIIAINNQLISHINGSADKHNTSSIINDSTVPGANTDDALETLQENITNGDNALDSRIDNLILNVGDSSVEVADARAGINGIFTVLKDRFDETDKNTIYALNAIGTNVLTATSNLTAYVAGLKVNLKIQNTNTGTVTLNINSLGAKTIKQIDRDGNKSNLVADTFFTGNVVQLQYDGTDFIVISSTSDITYEDYDNEEIVLVDGNIDYIMAEDYANEPIVLENDLLKILPTQPSYHGILKQYCPNFYDHWLKKDKDLNVVCVGESINTANNYASDRDDAHARPPLCHEFTLFSYLEEKLRWSEQKYSRFDGDVVFTELGVPSFATVNIEHEHAWDWQDGFGIIVTPEMNFRPAITRLIRGTDSGVSYTYPAKMRRCDFIYRTSHDSALTTNVTIGEGNGKVEVYDEGTASWVEANGYSFSMQESAADIDYIVNNYDGTTDARKLKKSMYQKRLKMRSLSDLTAKTVTIQNAGAGYFGYWGVQYSTNQYMINMLNQSRGGHNISALQAFEVWDVDYWEPDLIIQQCCVINEGAMSAINMPVSNTTTLFTGRFETYMNSFLAKGYSPELITFTIGLASQFQLYDDIADEFNTGYITGSPTTTVNTFDYINKLQIMFETNNILHINMFYRYLEIAKEKSLIESSDINTSSIDGSSETGTTFTIDGTHLNDYGNEIGKELLLPLFNIGG